MEHPGLPSVAGSVDDILRALAFGLDPDDDPGRGDGDLVGITEHGLQTAAALAARAPLDLELQVAGLVHDLGHLFCPGRPEDHGMAGARFVLLLLGQRVGELVELHVAAKRYLVTVDVGYRRRLSSGSIATLERQGGVMTRRELSAFVARPHWRDAVVLRRADEAAKVPGRTVRGVADWVPVLNLIAARHAVVRPR